MLEEPFYCFTFASSNGREVVRIIHGQKINAFFMTNYKQKGVPFSNGTFLLSRHMGPIFIYVRLPVTYAAGALYSPPYA